MHIAESRIIGLNVAHDGSDRVDVTIERVLVDRATASKLSVNDLVSLVTSNAFGPLAASEGELAQLKALHERMGIPGPVVVSGEALARSGRGYGGTVQRPEAPPVHPAFQAAFAGVTDHEIGVAYCKGFTYQYAYLKGATPADACRWSHIDETEVREELWSVEPGDIVYDIGSAFGSYALTALAMGAAHVVCFNPNPQEQDLLLASARLNGWGDKVTRHNVGLWSETGYLNDEEQTFTKAGGEFKVTKTADGRHTQLFEVQTLDSVNLTTHPGRAVAKLDVEGAEAHVLKGARRFFAQHQPEFVTIEVHVFKDASLEQQTDAAMADLGYVPVTKRPYHSVMHALYRMKGWDDWGPESSED